MFCLCLVTIIYSDCLYFGMIIIISTAAFPNTEEIMLQNAVYLNIKILYP